jgi:exopolysaccharide biosynthesis polyprenyl glycosylphosphotransferase
MSVPRALEAPIREEFQRAARRESRLLPIVVPFTDALAAAAVLFAATLISHRFDPALAALVGACFLLVVATASRPRLSATAIGDAGGILVRVGLAYAASAAAEGLAGLGHPRALAATASASAVALVTGRAVSYAVERRIRARTLGTPTLVVGAGDIARRVIAVLAAHPEYGLRVVGAVDDAPKFEADELGIRVLGGVASIPLLVEQMGIEEVVVAFGATEEASLVDVIRGAMSAGASVWMVPRFFELGKMGGSSSDGHLWGIPVVRLRVPARSRPAWALKRASDVIGSGLLIAVLSPFLALISLLILLEDGRPILFRQTRVGLDNRPFAMLKFRTMTVSDKPRIELRADESSVTRVGRFLRRTGLDELPQLFNVLRGDMSLVGPRPEDRYFVDLFSRRFPQYRSRHRMPAGITGWAQIHGLRGDRGETSIEERLVFDNYYIENWSLGKDVEILLRTGVRLFRR